MLRKPAKDADREELIRFNLAIWKMLDGPTYPRSEQALREFINTIIDRGMPASGFLRQYAAIVADRSRVDLLTGIRRPTLVIHGTSDPLVPVECGVDTARHVADSRLELFPGMGHSFPDQLLPHITELTVSHLRSAH
jgi:proline iminopeptidase